MGEARSPLELLHPAGIAVRACVLGGGCPAALLPSGVVAGTDPPDLIVLAPTVAECQSATWRRGAVVAMRGLAPDGIAYVIVPQRWRAVMQRALVASGLTVVQFTAHVPDVATSRHLLPLMSAPVRYGLTKLLPTARWRRALLLAALHLPDGRGVRLVGAGLPSVGLVARRPRARPTVDWLFRLAGANSAPGCAIVSVSRAASRVMATLHRFPAGCQQPDAVVKLALAGELRAPLVEARRLAAVGVAASRAGARLPMGQVVAGPAGCPVFLQTIVAGRSAAVLLTMVPGRLWATIGQVADWLVGWHGLTATLAQVDPGRLERDLLLPARALAPELTDGSAYLAWLEARCARVVGRSMPWVAAHHDLTTWNVLVDRSGRPGIIDWESAAPDDWPLADFAYFVVDAVAVAGRYAEPRRVAYDACFAPGGKHTRRIAMLLARLCRATGLLDDELVELCMHACWLRHAADEQQAAGSGQRQFLAVLQSVVVGALGGGRR